MTRVDVQPAPGAKSGGGDEEVSAKEPQPPAPKEARDGRTKKTPRTQELDVVSVDSGAEEMDEEASPSTTATTNTNNNTNTTIMCCESCIPHHSFKCRLLFFLVLFGLDVADLFSDWLLYADVSVTEKGLVYGPPEKSVIHALLAFSVIGTVTFLFEAVNLWWEVFRENPWLDVDLVSAVTIWIEDLPQIAINVYIANCREDPISVFQLSKASVVLIGLAVRIIISSVKYCNKAALEEAHRKTPESKRHVAYRVFIMLGLLINSACAITVFIFTQTQRDTDGGIMFQVPKTLFEDDYNDQRYFQNVSIFVHHPEFDVATPSSSTKTNWVRFMSINDIRDRSDVDISYNYVYQKSPTNLKMALFVKEDKTGNGQTGTWRVSECYDMDLASRQITTVSNPTCSASFSPQPKSVYITFSFTPPDTIFKKLIFGDIRFNIKTYQNGICKEYGDRLSDSVSADPAVPSIHYYRTSAHLTPGHLGHLLLEGGSAPRFYRNDGQDLQDITSVWKTGWGGCESSGSLSPNFRDSIPVHCSNSALAVAG